MERIRWSNRYLIVFAVSVIILLAPVFAFQIAVDPFGTWGAPLTVGFNHYKPFQKDTERLFKPYQYRNMAPRVVFFGSSRVNYIMPPQWPGVPDDKVFNYGINAAHIPEEAYFFHSAMDTHEPEVIAIGIDMLQFSSYLNKLQSGFSQRRLNMVKWSPLTSAASNAIDTVLSFDVLRRSMETIEENKASRRNDELFMRGWNTRGNKRHYNLREYKRVLWKFMQGTYQNYRFSKGNWRMFQQMISRAQETDATLYLYINPIHCDFLTTIYLTGKWDEFERFKKRLVTVGPVRDFNYVNSVTRVRDNFIDPSHFLPPIGVRMTQIMDSGKATDDFGIILTPDNIDRVLLEQRQAIEEWMASHPQMKQLQEAGVSTHNERLFQAKANPIILRDL